MTITFEDIFDASVIEGIRVQNEKKEARKRAKEEAECERSQKEKERKNIVWEKYFPEILSEKCLQSALLKSAHKGVRALYFNFDRSDFTGWHNLVEGGYKNAHPVKMVNDLLKAARKDGFIPSSITWDIWNNQAFTVLFTW